MMINDILYFSMWDALYGDGAVIALNSHSSGVKINDDIKDALRKSSTLMQIHDDLWKTEDRRIEIPSGVIVPVGGICNLEQLKDFFEDNAEYLLNMKSAMTINFDELFGE